ncbi:hypothetical protein DMC25_19005 [Caulobacter sp. D4A]|nr:hypothetical protein DMC25_19005 [Caulobacter sp. D4A]PXA86664.1 hypothetical protein DMC18_21705 [Caulobacter sp. D5]
MSLLSDALLSEVSGGYDTSTCYWEDCWTYCEEYYIEFEDGSSYYEFWGYTECYYFIGPC